MGLKYVTVFVMCYMFGFGNSLVINSVWDYLGNILKVINLDLILGRVYWWWFLNEYIKSLGRDYMEIF